MDIDRLSDLVQDCEIDQVLHEIQNESSGLGLKAVELLNQLAYFDPSNGVSKDLCCLLILSEETVNFECNNVDEEEAKGVLKILQDHKFINENRKKGSIQIEPDLRVKLLSKNRNNPTIVAKLSVRLKKIWMDTNLLSTSIVGYIHKLIKNFNWPLDSIQSSIYFAVQLLIDRYDVDMGLAILDDISGVSTTKCLNKADWFAIQMIRIYNDTILKSRKILQPSDTVRVENSDGICEDVCLNHYGSFILDKIKFCSDSELDCNTLILVGVATLDRLQKHERVTGLQL